MINYATWRKILNVPQWRGRAPPVLQPELFNPVFRTERRVFRSVRSVQKEEAKFDKGERHLPCADRRLGRQPGRLRFHRRGCPRYRSEQVDFSDPYYYASIVSLVKTDSAYASATLALALIGTFLGCVIGFAVGVLQTIPIDKNRGPLPAGLSGAR